MQERDVYVALSADGASDHNSLAPFAYRHGDVLLRGGVEQFIRDLTNSPYSHSGMCSDPKAEMAIDALPGHDDEGDTRSDTQAINTHPISQFFSVKNAPGGGDVYRFVGRCPGDPDATKIAKAAADWALAQVSNFNQFNILDPILDSSMSIKEDNQWYCSELVWRAYEEALSGYTPHVSLWPSKDFINLKKDEQRTLDLMRPAARSQGGKWSFLASDSKIDEKVRERIKDHNGYFIAPGQLAMSPLLKKVYSLHGSGTGPKSSSDGGKKG